MNSEELEQSLRSEFENYLKDVVAELKGDVSEFQTKIEAEFEAQKARMDEAFHGFSSRFDSAHEFDPAFTTSVVEHLRLARDEGSKIAANAFAEAEDLERSTHPEISFADIRDAINDISSKDSQSSILKTLITHAANYTQRGAFFIIKGENFAGWKVFGKETDPESSIRDIHFENSADTILGKAVSSLATVEGAFGSYSNDDKFLEPLGFGRPDRMYAIPLVARGRGVAVLYADYGTEGTTLNTDVLETLVKVAGLTVELLASNRAQPVAADDASTNGYAEDIQSATEPAPAFETVGGFDAVPAYEPAPEPEIAAANDFEFRESSPSEDYSGATGFDAPSFEESTVDSFETTIAGEAVDVDSVEEVEETPAAITDYSSFDPASIPEVEREVEPVVEETSFATEPEVEHGFEIPVAEPDTEAALPPVDEPETEVAPDVIHDELNPYENTPFDSPAVAPEIAGEHLAEMPAAPVVVEAEPVATVPRARLSDRQIDLPVEVAEDERRLHNDARRFARLLVSEIKLYNEQKVTEGRASSDLYERLKEAIDRSREMYDKRVQPPVAAKFDYFHYELVNSLAEGDEVRLGSGYAGAKV